MNVFESNINISELSYLKAIAVYFLGVLSIFTPCVYPVLPVTIALFAQNTKKRSDIIFRALAYISGIIVMYVFLGILSATTGKIFGSILENFYVVSMLAFIFFLIALSTFELLNFRIAEKIQGFAPKSYQKSLLGLFTLGLASGLLAAPCTGPVLLSILLLVAKEQSFSQGVVYLSLYSLGMGTVFFILAFISGFLSSLPKANKWLYQIKSLLGIAILFGFFYLIDLNFSFSKNLFVLSTSITPLLLFLILTLFIILLRSKNKILRFVIALVIALQIFTFYSNFIAMADMQSELISREWIKSPAECFNSGNSNNKITMIDIKADWCLVCADLERLTLSSSKVLDKLSDYNKCQLDYAEVPELLNKFKINGLPTILFLAPDGSEIQNSRISRFISERELLIHLDSIE